MIQQKLISVVIPVYNESSFLTCQIEAFLCSWKQSKFPPLELIIVENGSTDNTWLELLRLKKKYPKIILLRCGKPSYGQALKNGLLAANGGVIVCVDIDYFDFQFINDALNLIQQVDVVVGSKTHPCSIDSRDRNRLVTTRILNKIVRFIFSYPGTDTHGMKCFRNSNLLRTCIRNCASKDELFDTELLVRLYKEGVRIIEIPVFVREMRESRKSLVNRACRAIIEFRRILFSYLVGGMRSRGPLPVVVDDYGWSSKTDEFILTQLDKETQLTVSILANMIHPQSLALLIRYANTHQIHYSLHFNIVEGKPCCRRDRIQSLVDKNGNFYPLPWFVFRLFIGMVRVNEIRYELLAQYKKISSQVKIDHIDSHQHVHVLQPISEVINNCYEVLGRPYIRSLDSSKMYLSKKMLRYIVLVGLHTLFLIQSRLRFHKTISVCKMSHELLIHPGFLYDE